MWVGQIQVGADSETIGVIFDTGSDKLVIQGVDCFSCDGTVYDPAISGGKLVNGTVKGISYGTA